MISLLGYQDPTGSIWISMFCLNSERIILSFIFVGLLKRAIELSLKYANERKQFGQNLGEFEMIQEKIAYMYTKFRTSKLLCNYALESLKSSNMKERIMRSEFRPLSIISFPLPNFPSILSSPSISVLNFVL